MTIKTRKIDAIIANPDGSIVFEKKNFEIPEGWSDRAGIIVASKYATDNEYSALEVIGRVVCQIGTWGIAQGYLKNTSKKSDDNYTVFTEYLTEILVNQRASFNSPVWFNCGVPENLPQMSACFIFPVEDNMGDILEHTKREGMVFKSGSGAGVNVSKLRAKGEQLSNKGFASGPVSFMKMWDACAGSVKSGGKSRRSAKLVCMNVDHPDIMDFIHCKLLEERKAKSLIGLGYSAEEAYSTVAFQNANHSVRVTDRFMDAVENDDPFLLINRGNGEVARTLPAREIIQAIAEVAWETGDPGIQFDETMNEDNPVPSMGRINSTNPCFSGDTLVAVADGRGMVSFKQLAEEEVDVPVYTIGENGKLKVANMSNPRKTREKVPVYAVTFDSGLTVKTTIDHEFLSPDGILIPLKDLKIGDGVKSVIKYQARFKDAVPYKTNYKGGDYYFWENNGSTLFDHRLIASYKLGQESLSRGIVVHHKDFNSLNNSPDNLEPLDREAHNKLHSERMKGQNNPVFKLSEEERTVWKDRISDAIKGENNPNFSGTSNEDIIKEIKEITANSQFGYFTKDSWSEAGFPVIGPASKYRFKRVREFAEAAGVKYVDNNRHHKIIERYNNLVKNNYKFRFNPETLDFVIEKKCEATGEIFYVNYKRRHVSFINKTVQGIFVSRRKIRFLDGKINKGYLEDANTKRRLKKTLEAYKLYKENKSEDINFRKDFALIRNIVRPGNIFCPTVSFLKETADKVETEKDLIVLAEERVASADFSIGERRLIIGDSFNHTITSIQPAGVEDVYDGTVEGEHLVLVGGQEKVSKFGKPCYHFIVTSQCSEFSAIDSSSCNLASLNLIKYYKSETNSLDWDLFGKDISIMITAMDILIDASKYPTEDVHRVTTQTRPLGLGFTNLGALLIRMGLPYDSEEARQMASDVTRAMTFNALDQSILLGEKLGSFAAFEENKKATISIYERIANRKLAPDVKIRNSQLTLLAPTGCLASDTLILTSDGLIEIKELGNSFSPQWQNINTKIIQESNPSYATKFFINGPANTISITTRRGHNITSTPNHKFRVIDNEGAYVWREAQEIKEGDLIALRLGGHEELLEDKEYIQISSPTKETNQNNFILDEHVASVLGYYMGDGFLKEKGGLHLVINNKDKDLLLWFSWWAKRTGTNITIEDKEGCFIANNNSRSLYKWFKDNSLAKPKGNHGEGAAGAFIPKQILRSNTKVLCAFLRGLFEADGTITFNGANNVPLIELTTVSERLAKEVMITLESLGIPITLHKYDNILGSFGSRRKYRISIASTNGAEIFSKKINFLSTRKKERLSKAVSNISYPCNRNNRLRHQALIDDLYLLSKGLPSKIRQDILTRKTFGKFNLDWARELINHNPKLENSKLSYITKLNNLQFIEVSKVETTREKETYDLSVPENNTYTANGFISHNTISFMMDADTTGIEPLFALKATKTLAGGGTMEIIPECVQNKFREFGIERTDELEESWQDIFKTANEIHWRDHILMMAACQQHLNGAISKTINMPADATVEDILKAYQFAYKNGLKALAVYRDGSKSMQPMRAASKEDAPEELVEPQEPQWQAVRRRLPSTRQALNHKFNINGIEGFISPGMYEDGTLGEVFIRAQKQGSSISGLLDSFGIILSLALQYGVPLSVIYEKLKQTRFEPAGYTDNPDIRFTTSIMDYLARYLMLTFGEEEVEIINMALPSIVPTAEEPVKMDLSGPPCQYCGNMTRLVGTCFLCTVCGQSGGCS